MQMVRPHISLIRQKSNPFFSLSGHQRAYFRPAFATSKHISTRFLRTHDCCPQVVVSPACGRPSPVHIRKGDTVHHQLLRLTQAPRTCSAKTPSVYRPKSPASTIVEPSHLWRRSPCLPGPEPRSGRDCVCHRQDLTGIQEHRRPRPGPRVCASLRDHHRQRERGEGFDGTSLIPWVAANVRPMLVDTHRGIKRGGWEVLRSVCP